MSVWSNISPAVYIAAGALLTVGANTVQGRQVARRDEARDTRAAALTAMAARAERLRAAYAVTITFAERIKISTLERRIVWQGDTAAERDRRIATDFQRLRDQYNEHSAIMMLDPDARPIAVLMASMFHDEVKLRSMLAATANEEVPYNEVLRLTQVIEENFEAIDRACLDHLRALDLG